MEQENKAFVRRLYSVNLVTFIYSVTKKFPEVYRDTDSLVYFVYPDTDEISILINVYKNTRVQVDLHTFIEAFRDIKILMKTAK